MKKVLLLIISVLMIASLVACDSKTEDEVQSSTSTEISDLDTSKNTTENGNPESSDDTTAEDDLEIPPLKNTKVTYETATSYPVDQNKYLKLTKDDINEEFAFLRELMQYDDKHKNKVLNAYLEMGDDEWNRLYIDGELFGITGQYVVCYYNTDGETYDGYINSFGFHWMIDDHETHYNQIMHCLTTYFGEYGETKELYYNGETYQQYEWYKTTDELWSVWLSVQDTSGWLQITPVADVNIEEDEKETYIKDGLFTIAAYNFADDFEDAFDDINGHTFKTEAEVDESKSFTDVDNYVYYRILDDENYDRDVGMISFTKPNGKTLHISEEFSGDCWNGINILIEEAGDVSATVVASVLAIDPGIGYSDAFDLAQDIVDSISIYTGDASELESVDCNGIKYTLYKDNKYHYLLITALAE